MEIWALFSESFSYRIVQQHQIRYKSLELKEWKERKGIIEKGNSDRLIGIISTGHISKYGNLPLDRPIGLLAEVFEVDPNSYGWENRVMENRHAADNLWIKRERKKRTKSKRFNSIWCIISLYSGPSKIFERLTWMAVTNDNSKAEDRPSKKTKWSINESESTSNEGSTTEAYRVFDFFEKSNLKVEYNIACNFWDLTTGTSGRDF